MLRSETVLIRPAEPEDASAFLRLLEACHLPTAGAAACLPTTLLAWDADQLAGSAALEVYGPVALLRSVAVHPTRRGQGLGRNLVKAALKLAQDLGVEQVYLLTETAADYFPRFGFVPVPRDQVDARVQGSVEFTSACPASARAMVLTLPISI
ncbi:MAG: GNAT family N-acetyltransferase [Caldilineae bacterium]|nr:MAG: GNAT family N-acetyltransferase [Caldilineae bacterium]